MQRAAITRLCREMRARGLVASTCGNISVRHRDGMIITPTRTDYERLRGHQLVRVGPRGAGNVIVAPARASVEWPLHLAIYRARPDVHAVVHTHSPHATARSFDRRPVHVATEEADYLKMTQIDVAPWWPAGTDELAAAVTDALAHRPAALLERHGVLGVGPSARAALEMCAVVEHQVLIERTLRSATRNVTTTEVEHVPEHR